VDGGVFGFVDPLLPQNCCGDCGILWGGLMKWVSVFVLMAFSLRSFFVWDDELAKRQGGHLVLALRTLRIAVGFTLF